MKKDNHKREEPVIVALYARESGQGQKDKEISAPSQLQEMKAYCKKRGWLIYDEFVDRAKTGTHDKRKAFQALIYKAMTTNPPPFNKIIVWKLSRFARSKDDSRFYKARLGKRGISVHSMTQEAINEGGISGHILESFYEVMDEQFSRELSEHIKRAQSHLAQQGYYPFGREPFGYKAQKFKFGKYTRTKFAIDKNEAELVKKVFEMAGMGLSLVATAQELNHKGYRARGGRKFTKTIVSRILKNEKYTGTLYVGDTKYENFHEPIISQAEFEKVREAIKKRTPDKETPVLIRESEYILSGLLKCKHCGAKMFGYTAASRYRKNYHYYACTTYKEQGRSECPQKLIRRDKIEPAVKKMLENQILTEKNLKKVVKIVNVLRKRTAKEDLMLRTTLVDQLKSVKSRIKHIDEILIEGGAELGGKAIRHYFSEAEKLLGEREELELKLEELDKVEYIPLPDDVILAVCKDFEESFKNSNLVVRKSFLHSLIDRIIVKDDEAQIIYHPHILQEDQSLCRGKISYRECS